MERLFVVENLYVLRYVPLLDSTGNQKQRKKVNVCAKSLISAT